MEDSFSESPLFEGDVPAEGTPALSAEFYRAMTAPKLWPASGLLFTVQNPVSAERLAAAIVAKTLRAPLMVRAQLSGFLVFDPGSEDGIEPSYLVSNGRVSALRFCTVTRDVPKAALGRAKADAISRATREQGRPPTSNEKLTLETRAYSDLLRTALCEERECLIIYDHVDGLVFVGERTHNAALKAAGYLDAALTEATGHSVRAPRIGSVATLNMSRWLLEEQAPEGFTFGMSARLQGANKAKAAFDAHVLTTREVTDHLRAGLEVAELQLVHAARVQLTLTHTGFVRGIGLLREDAQEPAGTDSTDDADLTGQTALLTAVVEYADAVLPAIRSALLALAAAEAQHKEKTA